MSAVPKPAGPLRPSGASARALDRTDLLLYATVVVVWGTSWIALRLQLGVVAPEVSLVWRFALSTAVMLGVALVRRERLAFPWRDHLRFAALGALLFCGNFVLFYYGGMEVTSGLLAVVFSLASVGNLALSRLVFAQPLDPVVALGGLLGVGGVAAMFAPEWSVAGHASAAGLALCVAATLVFCAGNIAATIVRQRGASLVASTVWGMAYGTASLALIAVWRGQSFIIETTPRYVGSLVYLAVVASVVAFVAYLRLLDRIGAARAAYTTVLVPVVALLISTLVEGYQWTLSAMAGLALVLAGNALVLGWARRRA